MENPKPPVRALLITRSYATANTHIGSYHLCNKNLRKISQTVPKVYVARTGGLGFSIQDIGVLGQSPYEIWKI
jgi:hypothetical protein